MFNSTVREKMTKISTGGAFDADLSANAELVGIDVQIGDNTLHNNQVLKPLLKKINHIN